MKLSEMTAKLGELKTVESSEQSDEQKKEIQSLEESIGTETKRFDRYGELSKKDENSLTSEDVDELIQLQEDFADEEKPEGQQASSKKYAGKYDTVDELLKGIQSSEQEKEKLLKEHPELSGQLEDVYKNSQREVTGIVRKTKELRVVPQRKVENVPLVDRELHEMTQKEYDVWEKGDKLSAHSWLSNATRKESLRDESRKRVFAKYPQFYAMSQGVVPGDANWEVYDRIASEHPEWVGDVNGAEMCKDAMEKELDVTPVKKPVKKPVIIKKGFEQGRGGGGGSSKGAGGTLSVEEFEALSDDDRDKYMEGSLERKK